MRCREEGTIVTQAYSPRDYLEKEIADRARHRTAEDVRTTCSFARAERLLGREYHGRFLIELLQNAADASRSADTASGRSRVVVRITEGPALLVANQGERSDRPMNVFGAHSDLVRRIGSTFPSSYIRQQTGLGLPDNSLSDAALELVMARPSDTPDLWETIRLLCLPGENPPWDGPSADPGFRSLIELFAALDSKNREATRKLLDALRGDPRSRLLPTVGVGSSRVLLPIPDPSEGVPGRRSRLVMARVESSEGPPLVPPDDLDIAFLPDGLLSSEAERDRAKPLGVRPFTVDDVLDRLNGIEDAQVDGDALVRFLWQLLARERLSDFSTRRSAQRASDFDPSKWFWCRPGRARENDTARFRQQRERYLAAVPLPCRDGNWRQAGRISFGADWADWLEERPAGHPAARRDRISAYRAMEQVSPGPRALLASPEEVLSLLGEDIFHEESLVSDDENPGEAPDERQRDAQRHAFLLRLGVWEVPPIEAYEGRDRENRERIPWTGPVAEKQREIVERNGGWQFGLSGWAGSRHHNVYLAEDYRFLWPLEEMARRNVSALVTGLRLGAKLYRERSNALVFCPGCGDGGGSHRAWRHGTSDDGYPSWLAIQLRSDRWVPCMLDGEPLKDPSTPESAWWHPKPPSGAGLRQSPWRLVPLCGPAEGLNEDLRRLVGINTLDDARADAVEALLIELRAQFEDRRLPIDPATSGSARQAFVGLHRLAYERLSELSSEQSETAAVLDGTGILCELGEGLVYRDPGEARHDDGRFSTYVRHFVGSIPFVVLPRDKETVASRLGIEAFELGISADEVEAIKTRIGLVSEEERLRHEQWFRAILDVLGAESLEIDLDSEDLASRLRGAGLSAEVADRLVELGGGESVRRETGQGSALRLLTDARVDLKALHAKLLEADDSGLDIRDAQKAFSRWMGTNDRRLSAVLATRLSPDEAKAKVRSLTPPPERNLSLDSALADLLSPVVVVLGNEGLRADAGPFAHDPEAEFLRLGGFGTVEELDARVSRLFDKEEQRRFFQERAVQWRREIRLLAVLARTGPADTRTTIRMHDEAVTTILPRNPSSPSELQDTLRDLFTTHQELADKLGACLVESVNAAAPDREQLMEWAKQDGVAVDLLPSVERALEAPRRDRARKLEDRRQQLTQRDVRPVPPPGFEKIEPDTQTGSGTDGGTGSKVVAPIKVTEHHDRIKRELGDEGEQWALAAVVGVLMDLDDETRNAAIDDIVSLLGQFEGTPVDEALAHAVPARARNLDDEERIEEFSSLLHVSQYSDAFGFDLIGWLSSRLGGKGQAVCLEVKSSGGEGFHLSQGQWSVAEELCSEGVGDQYAVLVVRRAKAGGVPDGMDLLSNPVDLVKAGRPPQEGRRVPDRLPRQSFVAHGQAFPGSFPDRVRTAVSRGLFRAPRRSIGICRTSMSLCPSVVPEHPEAFILVEALIAGLVGASVCEHCDRDGNPRCRFEVAPADDVTRR